MKKGVASWKKGEMKNFEEYQHFKNKRKRNPEGKEKPGWKNPKREQEYQESATCLTTAKSRDKFRNERVDN